MDWTLDPAEYHCPIHDVDLTAEVTAEALAPGTPVYRDGVDSAPESGDDGWREPEYSPVGPFLVEVDCPGKASTEGTKAEPHRQSFSGNVR